MAAPTGYRPCSLVWVALVVSAVSMRYSRRRVERLTGVPGGEKEAKLPAIPVTTKIARISRATSTTLPPVVSGFVIADDSQQLHGSEEPCVAVTVIVAAFYAAFDASTGVIPSSTPVGRDEPD